MIKPEYSCVWSDKKTTVRRLEEDKTESRVKFPHNSRSSLPVADVPENVQRNKRLKLPMSTKWRFSN